MSRIDKLIADLCPDGVEFKRIADVSSKGSKIKWAQVGNAEYQYIDLGAVEPRTRQIGKTQAINSRNAPSRAQQIVHSGDIIFATTRPTQLRWTVIPDSYDGQVVSTGYCVIRPDRSSIITNYFAHTLGTTSFLKYLKANQILGNYPSIPDSRIQEFRIPVPPLEVQREITRVLDKFTQLEAELEAELEARRRQYEHYRNQLLAFSGIAGVQWVPMGKIGTLTRGRRFTKKDMTSSGVPCIHYGEIYTHYGVSTRKAISHVRDILATKLRYAKPGDVVIAGVGETVKDVAKAVAWLGETPVAIHDDTFSFRSEQDPAYISYAMQTSAFQEQKERWVSRAKVKRIGNEGISQIVIPVPSLEEQRRIVSILDKFDSLVNDLSIGLPAELEARRKQYEYYRDRLLTFEEKR